MPSDNSSTPVKKRSLIGLLGFIFAVCSLITCGLTSIPGLICSIIGIKKKSYRVLSWVGVVLSVIVICYISISIYLTFDGMPTWIPDFIKRSYADSRLHICQGYQNVKDTSLPDSARNIQVIYGGLFAKFIYLRFDVTREDAEKMFKNFGVTEPIIIGDDNGEKKMVSWDEFYKLYQESLRNKIKFDEDLYIKESSPNWLSWWNPTKIKNGKAYRLSILSGQPIRAGGPNADAPEGFSLYYDEDAGTIYFSWYWS